VKVPKSSDKRTQASEKLAKLLSANRSDHVSTAELRENSAAVISRVAFGGERIVVTRNRKPVAAIVPMEDFETLKKPATRGRAAQQSR
jgi:prevent-host-death family protein